MGQHQTSNDVFTKTVAIEPIGAIYSPTTKQIEDFVYEYLTVHKKVTGVHTARMLIRNEGNISKGVEPDISFILYLDLDSPDVSTNLNNIPQGMRHRVDIGSIQASEKLRDALYVITRRNTELGARGNDRVAYIRLDLIKVLSLMFAVKQNLHEIRVMDVKVTGKNQSGVIMLAKVETFVESNVNTTDRFARMNESIDRDRERD